MSNYSFRRDQWITVDQKIYRITQVVDRKAYLELSDAGVVEVRSIDDMLARFAEGRLKFLDPTQITPDQREAAFGPALVRTLADFPKPIQHLVIRRSKYLNELCPDGKLGFPRSAVKELLQRTWDTMNPDIRGPRPPCVASFYSWRRRWVWSNFDIRVLIDKWELRGRRSTIVSDVLIDLINEGIQRIYLTPERESKRETLDWIQHELNKENQRRTLNEAIPPVTSRALNRELAKIERYEILKARYGEAYARNHSKIWGKGPVCAYPLERVEVDNTPLDLVVIDSSTDLLLGRPWIVMMIDAYSRMIVGFHITFRKPSSRSVLRCLKHAVLPKTYLKERFPQIIGEWNVFGIIRNLVCDNGLEFHANDLETVCNDLGTNVIYCPTRSPQMKGRIERFLKTLNYSLIHIQPGTTFAKYDQRHAYDSDKSAAITLENLQELIHRWIIDVYAVNFHRGIQTTPKQKWDEGLARNPVKLPPSTDFAKILLGRSAKRGLSKNGIGIHALQYASPALQDLFARLGNIDVTVRSDPDDLSKIYVLDPTTQQYIEAECTLAGYADGLTAEQHRWILSKARKDYKSSPLYIALLAAKANLREFTAKIKDTQSPEKPKPRRSKAEKSQAREVLIQHEETRHHTSQVELDFDESEANEFPDEAEETALEIPLFPIKRRVISSASPTPVFRNL